MPQPLVTVAFPCFDQAEYVQQALRSLLAQNYAPLQIVISDDVSTDGTYEIVQEEVSRYDGPHRVQLHRNDERRGVENYNQLMSMAEADFIVMAHSDDIADADRVEKLVEAWQRDSVSMVSSNSLRIGPDGSVLGPDLDPERQCKPELDFYLAHAFDLATLGSNLAWDRKVFDRFGPLDHTRSAIATDSILPFLACLLRGIRYLPDQLLQRRVHNESREKRFMRSPDTDEQAAEESAHATRITQFGYMFETVRTKLSSDDPRRQKLLDRLAMTIVNSSIQWTTVRNRLQARHKQHRWLDVTASSAAAERTLGESK